MRSYKHQQGLSGISWLVIVLVVVFFGLCAFRMAPAYNDNLYVKSALKSLGKEVDGVDNMSNMEIRKKLDSFYRMNNVRGEAAKALEIDRRSDRTLVKVNYEIRVPLFANIAVVMTFNNVLDSSRPGACCKPPPGD